MMKDKIIIVLVFLVYSGILAAGATYKGYQWGAKDKQAEWNAAMAAATTGKIDTRTKQDAVQSSPIDGDVTNRRLLNGTF